MSAAVDEAFEVAGRMSEDSLALCDLAADVEDEELSLATAKVRRVIAAIGHRLTEIRGEEQAA